MQNISIGFLLGFTGNAIVTRLEGYRSMDDIVYPIAIFVLMLIAAFLKGMNVNK